jgi:hypothetical protein
MHELTALAIEGQVWQVLLGLTEQMLELCDRLWLEAGFDNAAT